jgi:hypothetical protein
VLQYADDTLLLLQATPEDARGLKSRFDQFTQATGLKINFHKSTVVPKHVDNDTLMVTMAILQCQQGTFPRTYLGLPLSNTKLRLSAFAPLIAKTDRYLAAVADVGRSCGPIWPHRF